MRGRLHSPNEPVECNKTPSPVRTTPYPRPSSPVGLHFRKVPINLVFQSVCSTFAPEKRKKDYEKKMAL